MPALMEGGTITNVSYAELFGDDWIHLKYSIGAEKEPGGGLILFTY